MKALKGTIAELPSLITREFSQDMRHLARQFCQQVSEHFKVLDQKINLLLSLPQPEENAFTPPCDLANKVHAAGSIGDLMVVPIEGKSQGSEEEPQDGKLGDNSPDSSINFPPCTPHASDWAGSRYGFFYLHDYVICSTPWKAEQLCKASRMHDYDMHAAASLASAAPTDVERRHHSMEEFRLAGLYIIFF